MKIEIVTLDKQKFSIGIATIGYKEQEGLPLRVLLEDVIERKAFVGEDLLVPLHNISYIKEIKEEAGSDE